MIVKELPFVKPGLQIRSLTDPRIIGIVFFIDHGDDDCAYVYWQKKDSHISAFYGNGCDCEVVTFKHNGNELPEYIFRVPKELNSTIENMLHAPLLKVYSTFKVDN